MANLNELAYLDATALAELVQKKEVKPIELVDATIARIERLNPELNAVITPMYDQAREAAEADPGGGPFAGVEQAEAAVGLGHEVAGHEIAVAGHPGLLVEPAAELGESRAQSRLRIRPTGEPLGREKGPPGLLQLALEQRAIQLGAERGHLGGGQRRDPCRILHRLLEIGPQNPPGQVTQAVQGRIAEILQ